MVVFILGFALTGLHRPPFFGRVCIIKGDGDQFQSVKNQKRIIRKWLITWLKISLLSFVLKENSAIISFVEVNQEQCKCPGVFCLFCFFLLTHKHIQDLVSLSSTREWEEGKSSASPVWSAGTRLSDLRLDVSSLQVPPLQCYFCCKVQTANVPSLFVGGIQNPMKH